MTKGLVSQSGFFEELYNRMTACVTFSWIASISSAEGDEFCVTSIISPETILIGCLNGMGLNFIVKYIQY